MQEIERKVMLGLLVLLLVLLLVVPLVLLPLVLLPLVLIPLPRRFTSRGCWCRWPKLRGAKRHHTTQTW